MGPSLAGIKTFDTWHFTYLEIHAFQACPCPALEFVAMRLGCLFDVARDDDTEGKSPPVARYPRGLSDERPTRTDHLRWEGPQPEEEGFILFPGRPDRKFASQDTRPAR